ncbi:PD-(D/E)XK nuclease family protein [Leptospira levettii]|uniref:PD-(D/E)XK nuclease family protein n=1 Tax=Leptospira levettii TaxID=2023178 RepID=UPI00223C9E88|nr:PD-(D/E)XK nuclease family protein [Leptospira levettii]MCW7509746.1 PD-(D/E)XK nuclease family protein [Leptospira levettii]MCW7520833.1 PD-(D/E)XK nuclease family protein [Leptospira levettii]
MLKKLANLQFRELKRISPSQYASLQKCSYRHVLSAALRGKVLLPLPANAYLGTILHEMLERIAKFEFETEDQLEQSFRIAISECEEKLTAEGFTFLIPLKENCTDFGMKKFQLKKHLQFRETRKANVSFQSERWLESKDRSVGGSVDLIIKNDSFIEIVDFKTGRIMEENMDEEGNTIEEIKPEYSAQLKLYACLYHEVNGVYPSKLSLVDLGKTKFEIPFSEKECELLLEQAKNLLKKVNLDIETKQFSPNPSKENCSYCLVRPACFSYDGYMISNPNSKDIKGTLVEVNKYINGNVSIDVQTYQDLFTISNIARSEFDALIELKSQTIKIFNLKRSRDGMSYESTKMTQIYVE